MNLGETYMYNCTFIELKSCSDSVHLYYFLKNIVKKISCIRNTFLATFLTVEHNIQVVDKNKYISTVYLK
jgi:hypothetical protein